ncbi:MAG: glycosyltransferase family 4 protein [Cycloclasticus sp.]|nr:glycosyltransferase family 4 protein [Cycloclasticus sp.]
MKVAYLAPELPALSATFVYNEILQLETLGVQVVPFSVHPPSSQVTEQRVEVLAKPTLNLYAQSKLKVLKDNLLCLLKRPVCYVKTLLMVGRDSWQVGVFSRIGLGMVYRFFFASSLARQLAANDCDHLHVHFAHIPTDIAMYASSLSSVPFSVTAHANDIYERGWLLREKVERSAFFATISEFNKRYLESKDVDASKICIVRCGVEPSLFSKRADLPAHKNTKIGVIGRLVEKKGFDTLIKAMSILKTQGVAIELQIAGSGPLLKPLQALAISLGLDSQEVTFLGAIPHAEVASFIKSLDAFVLPCKQDSNGDIDGIPVVLMEAMLSGVPVISSELSGIPELIVHKETGLLVAPNSEQELADTILMLMNSPALKNQMTNHAVSKVKREFSLEHNANKLKDMFNRVINGTA